MFFRSIFIAFCGSVIWIFLLGGCSPPLDEHLVGTWKSVSAPSVEEHLVFRTDGVGLKSTSLKGVSEGWQYFQWTASDGSLEINGLGEEGELGQWESHSYQFLDQRRFRVTPSVLSEGKTSVYVRIDNDTP
ncbi:MAG: hypothetical protein H0W86_11695 [Armatimonadetes bacterium]|nr:hypothetical protein [Armatimonadota bacterium]